VVFQAHRELKRSSERIQHYSMVPDCTICCTPAAGQHDPAGAVLSMMATLCCSSNSPPLSSHPSPTLETSPFRHRLTTTPLNRDTPSRLARSDSSRSTVSRSNSMPVSVLMCGSAPRSPGPGSSSVRVRSVRPRTGSALPKEPPGPMDRAAAKCGTVALRRPARPAWSANQDRTTWRSASWRATTPAGSGP